MQTPQFSACRSYSWLLPFENPKRQITATTAKKERGSRPCFVGRVAASVGKTGKKKLFGRKISRPRPGMQPRSPAHNPASWLARVLCLFFGKGGRQLEIGRSAWIRAATKSGRELRMSEEAFYLNICAIKSGGVEQTCQGTIFVFPFISLCLVRTRPRLRPRLFLSLSLSLAPQ